MTSLVTLVVKNMPTNAGDVKDMGLIPGSGRSLEEGNGNLLQCSCQENPMDRGVGRLQSTGSQSQAWLKWLSMQWCMRDSFLPELTSICIDISFYFSWSDRYAVIALVALICISLIVKDVNHFFICLFAICILSEAILPYWRIQIFCLFLLLFFFFWLSGS